MANFDIVEFYLTVVAANLGRNPTYGTMALIVGTASVTGFAVLTAIPLPWVLQSTFRNLHPKRAKRRSRSSSSCWPPSPALCGALLVSASSNPLIIELFNVPIGLNILNAGVILGLMSAPIMCTIAEDALKAVPDKYREAAEALGATKWQVIRQVVLPAGKNGLMAAALLGVGRGFETMAVLMASGHSINIPNSPFDSVRALTATIAAELGETANGSEHYQALFTLGICSLWSPSSST